jgi:hypothetical protein
VQCLPAGFVAVVFAGVSRGAPAEDRRNNPAHHAAAHEEPPRRARGEVEQRVPDEDVHGPNAVDQHGPPLLAVAPRHHFPDEPEVFVHLADLGHGVLL